MANWKKVIVSGSLAELSGLELSSLLAQPSEGTVLTINDEGIVGTKEGASGTSGSSGSSGSSGTNGSSGTDGTSGSSGSSGTDGTSGSSGSSGTDGTSGSSGTDGTSGSSGTDGTSGSSGTDGTSGSSGSSGLLSLTGNTVDGVITLGATGAPNADVNNNLVFNNTGGSTLGGLLTVTGDVVISHDLTVQGTASFQNSENLLVADRFILLASGSNSVGDGGFMVTNNKSIYERARILRNHGTKDRNVIDEFGFVSRLDTIQAAVLDYRLKKINGLIKKRRKNASLYKKYLTLNLKVNLI